MSITGHVMHVIYACCASGRHRPGSAGQRGGVSRGAPRGPISIDPHATCAELYILRARLNGNSDVEFDRSKTSKTLAEKPIAAKREVLSSIFHGNQWQQPPNRPSRRRPSAASCGPETLIDAPDISRRASREANWQSRVTSHPRRGEFPEDSACHGIDDGDYRRCIFPHRSPSSRAGRGRTHSPVALPFPTKKGEWTRRRSSVRAM